MKKITVLLLMLLLAMSLVLTSCGEEEATGDEPAENEEESGTNEQEEGSDEREDEDEAEKGEAVEGEYPNGRYRGIFEDRGVQQVSIQFHLEDGVLHDLSYRYLFHGGNDYLEMDEDHELYPVVLQHQQIIDYLEGKPDEAMFDLYQPENVIEDIDGFTGETIRGNKVLSAIRDGLNKGLY